MAKITFVNGAAVAVAFGIAIVHTKLDYGVAVAVSLGSQ